MLIVTTSVCAWFNWLYAKSILIGGLIFLVPTIYFGLLTFRSSGEDTRQLDIHNMYRGVVGKFLLTSIGFAGVFIMLKPIDEITLFSSYLIMVILNVKMLSSKDLL